MKRCVVLTTVLSLLAIGCGGDDSDERLSELEADTVAESELGDSVEDSGAENPTVDPLDDAACAEAMERINSCGLYYSFETFEADCAAWAASGDSGRLFALEDCLVQPCQPLLGCLEAVVDR